jgi:FixJ family two-component response regulator
MELNGSNRIYKVPAQVFADIKDFILPHNERVLVVDDDPAMLRGVARVLRQHGYEPVLFPTAEAFKNYSNYEEAACIILDINLNDGSGIDLRQRLTAARISVPVIYITANETQPFARRRCNPAVSPILPNRSR